MRPFLFYMTFLSCQFSLSICYIRLSKRSKYMYNVHLQFFCLGQPTTTPLNCPVGRYCTGGTINPELCPAGTYQPNENAVELGNCTQCTPGKYCGVPGLDAPTGNCSAGFYCTGGADVADPDNHLVSNIWFLMNASYLKNNPIINIIF